jgi:tetratricopeptide (TPR) repeat protein
MKTIATLLFFVVFGTGLLYSGDDPMYRERVKKGVQSSYQLDYAGAFEIFSQIKKEDPESPVGYGMIAVTAWNKALFDARNLAVFQYGLPTYFDAARLPEESFPEELQRFEEANNTLLDVCEELIEKNPRNALAHYFKGVSYENLSMQALMLYRNPIQTKNLSKTAGKAHEEALKLDPSLVDAKTSMAVVEYAVGSFNIVLRKMAEWFYGLPGDKKAATKRLQEVIDTGIFRVSDSLLVMGYLEGWKGEPERAVRCFQRLREMYPRNFMLDICLAVAYEYAAKDSKSALEVYRELLRDLPLKAQGIHPAEIHLRMGKNYFKLRDYGLALEQFQKALDTEHRVAETQPLAYYYMALVYEKRGEKDKAKECYRKMLELADSDVLIKEEMKRAKKKTR